MEGKVPLFIVTGASGSGKTYVIPALRAIMPEYDVFDLDSIGHFVEQDWDKVRQIWLRVARNAAQSGRMSIICGTMMPWDVEKCADFHYFKHVYYINLHCQAEVREQRLQARKWNEQSILEHKNFAEKLLELAETAYKPPMPTIDTTEADVYTVASRIKDWVMQYAAVCPPSDELIPESGA